MELIKKVEQKYLRKGLPDFKPGDTVRVWVKIQEGDKERLQAFEGICIRKRKGGAGASFTVRKISYGIGVERIFPLNSPAIDKIEVIRHGKVRRAKLYYLRKLRGKAAKVKTKRKQLEIQVPGEAEQEEQQQEQAQEVTQQESNTSPEQS